jgi:hypothetical protein
MSISRARRRGRSNVLIEFNRKGQDLLNAPSRRQNGKDIEVKCPPQAVILPARAFCFEIEAILASFGFDPYCPYLRWQAWT